MFAIRKGGSGEGCCQQPRLRLMHPYNARLKASLEGGEREEERRGRVMGSGACGLALLECGMGLIAPMNVKLS